MRQTAVELTAQSQGTSLLEPGLMRHLIVHLHRQGISSSIYPQTAIPSAAAGDTDLKATGQPTGLGRGCCLHRPDRSIPPLILFIDIFTIKINL